MRSITLRNYRCFGDEPQTARLAPLTLLVGENSSGKTSLMAMLRALWDVVHDDLVPDFKEDPYDLGSFEEIAHHRGSRGSRAVEFEAGIQYDVTRRTRNGRTTTIDANVKFMAHWSAPVPVSRRFDHNGYWIDQDLQQGQLGNCKFGSPNGEWQYRGSRRSSELSPRIAFDRIPPVRSLLFGLEFQFRDRDQGSNPSPVSPLGTSEEFTQSELDALSKQLKHVYGRFEPSRDPSSIFASGPVRSRPQRVYSYDLNIADALGDYIPSYLAQLALRDPEFWKVLQERLVRFGKEAGLFDQIRVHHLGKTDADPFQIQVRKFTNRAKGPFRNLVDVGYGISQVLPVAVEILKDKTPATLLLQQPEVHLHPSAQAAVGTLLCEIASMPKSGARKQLIVETHSDYIIDRVRMAVANKDHPINTEDVSIVYFERDGLAVKLHSLTVDSSGNVVGAPSSYRQFFLDELQQSVGF